MKLTEYKIKYKLERGNVVLLITIGAFERTNFISSFVAMITNQVVPPIVIKSKLSGCRHSYTYNFCTGKKYSQISKKLLYNQNNRYVCL